MTNFFNYFYDFFIYMFSSIGTFFKDFFVDLWGIFNVANYHEIMVRYMEEFAWYEMMFAILTIIIVLGILGVFIWLLVMHIRSSLKKRKVRADKNALIDQIEALNRRVLSLVDEKQKILAMNIAASGLVKGEQEEETAIPTDSRFVKLTEVDRRYNGTVTPFAYKEDYDLPKLIHNFLGYCNNTLHLYYKEETIRCFLAGMATTRLIILEGISGTGKTSLPYAFGKFVQNPTTIVPVQPSWRDKTELVGYFNEFTKRFNETDFLRAVYEATYREDIGFIVLDEMNLARIEYYFASVLSILEMPNREEWKMEIVGDSWDSDPLHLIGGNIMFPANMWFVGTANQDDSTFSITDKVYDRAMPIALNSKGKPFEIEPAPPQPISLAHLEKLFAEAKQKYPVSEETKKKFDKLDDFIIENFRLAFGNRILKQIDDFVPVYVAAGGTELGGIDYMLTYKILRKLEGLNISFVQDNLKATVTFLDELFGKKAMSYSKQYLKDLIKKA